jgi:hemerythrin-like domain-containing protein
MSSFAADGAPASRRRFLGLAAASTGMLLAACASAPRRDGVDAGDEDAAEVTPGEDLMQEHGVVERLLLVYDEAARRLERGEPLDASSLVRAANLMRRFVEEYHERLEEQFVFPRLEAARREAELVATLRRQHERGRELTAEIARLAPAGAARAGELAAVLRNHVRMYRPHAAREDTVLFPAFRSVVRGAEYRELGERFESQERSVLGPDGFERAVADVALIERALGIDDLTSFTPP